MEKRRNVSSGGGHFRPTSDELVLRVALRLVVH